MLTLFRNIFAAPRDLILVLAAAWLGLTLSEKRADRHGLNPNELNNLLFAALLAYIVGGRLFYAAEHLNAFIKSPFSLVSINITLFDIWGALVAAFITGFVYSQRRRMSLLPSLDALTPFFATLAVGIGFSHLATGAAFGQETTLPWGINLWSATRHPTQIYEIIASLLTLGLLWFRKADSKPGSDFLFFVALTSASQVLISGFRGDSTLILGGLRAEQIAAWVILLVSLIGIEFLKPKEVEPVMAGGRVYPVEKPRAKPEARKSAPRKAVMRKETKKKTRRS